jgi:hypothetical protein
VFVFGLVTEPRCEHPMSGKKKQNKKTKKQTKKQLNPFENMLVENGF